MTHYCWNNDRLTLHCHIQPKSSKDEVVGIYNGRLKIRITAPPVDGKANDHLVRYIAKALGVAKSAVTVKKGHSGREKTLEIIGPTKLPLTLKLAQ